MRPSCPCLLKIGINVATKHSRSVARVRSGASHRATLVTAWRVRVTGIEFINDYRMEANGNNRSNTDPDRQFYPAIGENFQGWGRGMPLSGWDWDGRDNLERAACYHRQRPIQMKVRLQSSLPAPTPRTFTLQVAPSVDGAVNLLTPGSTTVDWPAGASEKIVNMIATGGALPDEVSRYHVRLTWSVNGITPAGVINRSNHKIFGIYEDPLDPDISSASGSRQSPVDGLTKQRLDKLTLAIGSASRRFRTPTTNDVHRLIWKVCQAVNDSGLHFYGGRNNHLRYGAGGPSLNVVDNWLMWLHARQIPPDSGYNNKPWNVGACITYAQLMKTMLATAGINSRLAWVFPKTTRLPDGSNITLTESQLVATDDWSTVRPQSFTITVGSQSFPAEVKLIGGPLENNLGPYVDNFEACLYYDGNLVPGAFATTSYPSAVQRRGVGFTSALELTHWWMSRPNNGRGRFMAWVADTPGGRKYFDKNGTMYDSPYDPHFDRLPVPN